MTVVYLVWRFYPAPHLNSDRRPSLGSTDDTHGLWRSLVSALDWGSRGRRFKSSQPDAVTSGFVSSTCDRDSPWAQFGHGIRGDVARGHDIDTCELCGIARSDRPLPIDPARRAHRQRTARSRRLAKIGRSACSGSASVIVAAALAPPCLAPLMEGERSDHERRERIGPPPPDCGVEHKPDEEHRRQIGAEHRLATVGDHAVRAEASSVAPLQAMRAPASPRATRQRERCRPCSCLARSR